MNAKIGNWISKGYGLLETQREMKVLRGDRRDVDHQRRKTVRDGGRQGLIRCKVSLKGAV